MIRFNIWVPTMEQLVAIKHEWEVRLNLRSKYGMNETHKSGPFQKRSTAEAVASNLAKHADLLSVEIVDLNVENRVLVSGDEVK